MAVSLAGPGNAEQTPPAQAPAPVPQGAPVQSAIEIDHTAPACVAAGKYARLDACFRPVSQLARARVYFRAFGTRDWFYVEMTRDMPCHHGTLPRPKKDVGRIEYYISATDRRSSEARTKDATLLVTSDGSCPAGPLAPIADAGSVVIGSASGVAPIGFVTGGLSPLLIVGGVAVVGGGTAAILAGGGGDTPTTTTSTTTTTTSTTTSSTTSTTTTTTTLAPTPGPNPTTTTTTMPCESPSQKPTVQITKPQTGPVGNPAELAATASDPAPGSGVKQVSYTYQYCPGGLCGNEFAIGSATTAPYTVFWTNQPSCSVAPEDRFTITARAVDNCGNVSNPDSVQVRSVGRGCFRASATQARSGTWQSELALPAARGQVVVDGAEAVFPSAGAESFASALGPGAHRFEATLVDGGSDGRDGRRAGGAWRFDLSALRLTAGSLRVVAGEAIQVAGDAVVFRLRGRAGERVVFVFELAGQ